MLPKSVRRGARPHWQNIMAKMRTTPGGLEVVLAFIPEKMIEDVADSKEIAEVFAGSFVRFSRGAF